jgi:hypothetical protein
MDVRSAWQTKKARQGKSQADRAARLRRHVPVLSNSDNDNDNDVPVLVSPSTATATAATCCTQQIDNLLIHYTIEEATETERPTSKGSGAEDKVIVTSIQFLAKQ